MTKQFSATLVAALLTAGAATAAVVVNLSPTSQASPTPAGQLVAVESTTTAPAPPPSTIVVDVTVPDLPPVGGEPVTALPEFVPTAPTDAGAPAAGRSGGDRPAESAGVDAAAEPVLPVAPPAPSVGSGGGRSSGSDDDHAEDRDDDHGREAEREVEGRDDDD